ncbi:MAG: hypothetical protein ACREK5_02460 [Gemmatimonadota bacterium]
MSGRDIDLLVIGVLIAGAGCSPSPAGPVLAPPDDPGIQPVATASPIRRDFVAHRDRS